MQNPGQLLSSDPIRHALQAAKHASMHEMGDAVEAYVLLHSIGLAILGRYHGATPSERRGRFASPFKSAYP